MLTEILCAGFGGQGVLVTGSLIAYCAFDTDRHFTWYPSYGGQMRGGTANSTVKVDDEDEIATPIVKNPDILIAMNGPSVDAFEPNIKPGGYLFVNSSLVKDRTYRDDIKVIEVDTDALAAKADNPRGGNIALIGKLIKETGLMTIEECDKAIEKYFADHGKSQFAEANKRALMVGYES